jgi:hypothetical protein
MNRRDEETGGWRKLRKEEPRDLYPTPNIIRLIKSSKIKSTGNAARTSDKSV